MKETLRILHLEDLATDAGLVARELKNGNIDCEILVVDTQTKFVSALADFAPDIILSDHSLASFDSYEALKLVKAAGIAAPFILVTATMTDEYAANVMKLGADDYIIKDRLHRLPLSVINSIEKHRLRDEQQSANDRLAFHIENTPLGFIEWDAQLQVKSMSKRAEEIFGWSLKEFLEDGRNGYSQVFEEYLPLASKIAADLITGAAERNSVQHKNTTKDGQVIWCEWFNSVLKDKNGKVITIMSLVKDITHRKHSEENLVKSESRLKKAEAIAQVGNWEIDLSNNSNIWSDEMYRIFGLGEEKPEPSADLFLSFIHPDDFEYANGKVEQAFRSFQNSSFYFKMIRADGVIRYGYSEWEFEFSENRVPTWLFGIVQDVTEQKLAEIEHAKMLNDIIQRNKHLEQFAYIISHNLRAPVANILGAEILLSDDKLNAEDRDTVNKGLHESVHKLDSVVKDLNHILQIKHEIDERKVLVCFSELVDEIKISIINLIEKEGIEIKCDFSAIDELLTVKTYLYSIFYNLISNSIKYRSQSVPGLIEIKSALVKNKVELTFTDNGVGIDLQKHNEYIFGLYKRFHADVEGKGMGLFMVKTQVETLGGEISVESTVNEGTIFKIELEV